MSDSASAKAIEERLTAMADEGRRAVQQRFFKTGPGEYGEGDRFLGVMVPQVRALVKEYRRRVALPEMARLVESPWHEVRLCGFLLMVDAYHDARTDSDRKRVVDLYLANTDHTDNWDLVDLSCYKLLGEWVARTGDTSPLYRLAADTNLWRQRIAIVSTMTLVRKGHYDVTLDLARSFLDHPHDLMHKATGWLLREVGKHDESTLRTFLDENAPRMPRTALRYAIERLPADVREHYRSLR